MNGAVVLLSGGIDSTVCLFLARKIYNPVYALSVDYGQRHRKELEAAEKIAGLADVSWEKTSFPALAELSDSFLTGSGEDMVVPGRNIILLTLASVYALGAGVTRVVIGVCGTDFADFPDCRPSFLESLQTTVRAGVSENLSLVAPLIHLAKEDIFSLARAIPGAWNALAHTITCYRGEKPGCGKCPACIERRKGLEKAGLSLE